MNKYDYKIDGIETVKLDLPRKFCINFDAFDEIVIKTNGSEIFINKDKLLMFLIEIFRQ